MAKEKSAIAYPVLETEICLTWLRKKASTKKDEDKYRLLILINIDYLQIKVGEYDESVFIC